MEASPSCSSPLSVHSTIKFSPPLSSPHCRLRRVSAVIHSRHGAPKLLSLSPKRSSSFTGSTSGNSSSSYFGISIAPGRTLTSVSRKRVSPPPISASFERFTERAIKAVVFSQREAKALGKEVVLTQHLLLGLVAESRAPDGFLGSGITIDMAREAVRSIWDDEVSGDRSLVASSEVSSATDVPFSISTKRVFEAAVEYSRTMGYNFIAPEHIAIGLFTVDDGSAARVLKRTLIHGLVSDIIENMAKSRDDWGARIYVTNPRN